MQISLLGLCYPVLVVTYLGQAAWLTAFPDQVSSTFYASIPFGDGFFWVCSRPTPHPSFTTSHSPLPAFTWLTLQSMVPGYKYPCIRCTAALFEGSPQLRMCSAVLCKSTGGVAVYSMHITCFAVTCLDALALPWCFCTTWPPQCPLPPGPPQAPCATATDL